MHVRTLTLCVAIALTAACGRLNSGLPSAPARVSSPAVQALYKLGPLDQIEIFVWRAPELSATVTIRPDGNVALPLVPQMRAAGKTTDELARDITEKLKTYVREPLVTVLVRNFSGSFDQQVRVIGAGKAPGALPYRAGMSLLDVVIAVGGLREEADGNAAVLVRRENNQKLTFALRLDDLVRDGDITANVPVLPGDVVIIPESRF